MITHLETLLPSVDSLGILDRHQTGIEYRDVQSGQLGPAPLAKRPDAGEVAHIELPHLDFAPKRGTIPVQPLRRGLALHD